ncbi:lytic transglycosylase domain-containing protein [Nocardioides convexus]|uniref:aggregation-promoting factor C-terminal-like domain-containing protein n=1 Tax=Nocardioides convexus TaxID=2712224 RepID=UPI0024187662|nr:lytic transglycosylase domain-containing protein [Nocardioides convexus]
MSSVAVAVTGVSVTAGVLGNGTAAPAASAEIDAVGAAGQSLPTAASTERRDPVVSRSDRRPEADPAKTASLADATGSAMTDERKVVRLRPARHRPGAAERVRLLRRPVQAASTRCGPASPGGASTPTTPGSSAYGIPQALPGSKMSSAGPDWATNPATQIRWGLGYIQSRYGSPCSAWGHSESHNWY